MSTLSVGLFGFGRTGRLVAREILADEGLELSWVVRRNPAGLEPWASRELGLGGESGPIVALDQFVQEAVSNSLRAVDVIIDFSGVAGIHAYESLARFGTKVVSAVSNYDDLGRAALARAGRRTAVLHSPNITVGINFLMVAAKAMRALIPEADVAVVEEHFREKVDVSGTAVRLARTLGIDDEAAIHSVRAGGIVGRHEVIFGLPNQTVRLVHESISRAAFGRGAIFAARWLQSQGSGLYSMEDAVREAMTSAVTGT